MKRTNKIYYIFLFLFFSIIFQIVIVVKLNAMENDIHKKKHQNESLKENSDHLHTNDPSSDNAGSSISNKQPDSQDVISLEELANEFQNSLVIGDSRVEGLKKFTALTDYADLCCNVGININNIMNDQFFIHDEQITPLESIEKHQYKRILIAIGYNELGWAYEDTFINKYTDFINKIQSVSPNSQIYIISVLHVNESIKKSSLYETNERIDLYNTKLKQLSIDLNLNYIDLNKDFTDDSGNLLAESTTDGIHFNAPYCNQYLFSLTNALKK